MTAEQHQPAPITAANVVDSQAAERIEKARTDAFAAHQRKESALQGLDAAVREAREAVSQHMRFEATFALRSGATKAETINTVVEYATRNEASWSGGPLGSNNLRESLMREAAVDFLRRNYNSYSGQH